MEFVHRFVAQFRRWYCNCVCSGRFYVLFLFLIPMIITDYDEGDDDKRYAAGTAQQSIQQLTRHQLLNVICERL